MNDILKKKIESIGTTNLVAYLCYIIWLIVSIKYVRVHNEIVLIQLIYNLGTWVLLIIIQLNGINNIITDYGI